MKFKQLHLQKGKEKALNRRHPWIFSGALRPISEVPEEGELVEVLDKQGHHKATGFFLPGQISVKVFSFEPITDPQGLVQQKIKAAIDYRQNIGLLSGKNTNCLRLVFGEGDGMPGLIIDKYDKTAVLQIYHRGWIPFLDLVTETLMESELVSHVHLRPSNRIKDEDEIFGSLADKDDNLIAQENGHRFEIDWREGQKTGFYLDQRENRQKLAQFAAGKTVLNAFSYTGGFSIYALKAGATRAVSVDSSESAIALAQKNAELNQLAERHTAITEDVFEYLKSHGEEYDIIILDPPAFTKGKRAQHKAVQAYKRLNLLALKRIKKGGLIFTFSCSQNVGTQLFEDTIRAAAIESGRAIRIVQKLGQPADHPVNIFFPEGNYLKGLILEVA